MAILSVHSGGHVKARRAEAETYDYFIMYDKII